MALTHNRFIEDREPGGGAVLIPLTMRPDYEGVEWHPATNRALSPEETLWVTGFKAVEPFMGTWVPLPFLRVIGRSPDGSARYDAGPANWARLHIARPAGELRQAGTLKAVIAFDTEIDASSRLDVEQYLTPSIDDVRHGAEFALAPDPAQLGEFLAEGWLDTWLASSHEAWLRQEPDEADRQDRFVLEHVARYLTLLKLIESTGLLPAIRFVDTGHGGRTVRRAGVDLALDMGADRTAAILFVQDQDDAAGSAGRPEGLRLRDLSRPTETHSGPFPTLGEFQRPDFGNSGASRMSGRLNAFFWPSLLRVGEEGRRLSLRPNAVPGLTGLAGLPEALAETSPRATLWRFSRDSDKGEDPGAVVSGEILAHMTEDGSVIGENDGTAVLPALRPRFSASAMLTMFAAEIVLHAVAQIGDPGRYAASGAIHQLHRVIVTCPASFTDAERHLLLLRVQGGIDLVWTAMGWEGGRAIGAPPKPAAVLGLDAGLSAQLVYLHDEVAGRFGGNIRQFAGLARGTHAAPGGTDTLTIASLDFTGSATGLAIVEYGLGRDNTVRPQIVLCDRSSIAGNSLVDDIAVSVVLPAVVEALERAGHPAPWQLAEQFLPPAAAVAGQAASASDFNRRLSDRVRQRIMRPAAAGILAAILGLPQRHAGSGLRQLRLSRLVERGHGTLAPIDRQIEQLASRAGAEGFCLGDVAISLASPTSGRLIDEHFAPLFTRIAEVVGHYHCDLVVMSGPYSGLSALRQGLVRRLPIAPHRLVSLAERGIGGEVSPGDAARDPDWLRLVPLLGGSLVRSGQLEMSGLVLLADELTSRPALVSGAGLAAIGQGGHADARIAGMGTRATAPGDVTSGVPRLLEAGQ